MTHSLCVGRRLVNMFPVEPEVTCVRTSSVVLNTCSWRSQVPMPLSAGWSYAQMHFLFRLNCLGLSSTELFSW